MNQLPPISEFSVAKKSVELYSHIQKAREINHTIHYENIDKNHKRFWLCHEFLPVIPDDIYQIISYDDIPLPFSEEYIETIMQEIKDLDMGILLK